MQNPCSCHWRELTDFLSTSRSSRKDKEIWEISSLAAIWEPAGPRHAAPIETVAACPLACRWHRRGSAGFLNLGWKHSVRGRPARCPLRHALGVPQPHHPHQIISILVDLLFCCYGLNIYISCIYRILSLPLLRQTVVGEALISPRQ